MSKPQDVSPFLLKAPKPPSRQTPSFGAAILRRTLFEGLGRRRFGDAEIEAALQFFGSQPLECSFCGSLKVSRWDHLVSIRTGGETVLGNMVPACGSCGDSKSHRAFEVWMRSAAPLSPARKGVPDLEARIAKLYRYMDKFNYSPTRLEDRLTQEEADELRSLQERLETIRRDADTFISRIAARLTESLVVLPLTVASS
jgi:hypothetical protein